MQFTRLLQSIQQQHNSLLCIGLDSDPAKLPPSIRSSREPVLEFNRAIIRATSEFTCAYKINLAFYEAMGVKGWDILRETLSLIPSHILTIGDAKRGDIGNTAKQYAKALLEDLGFGATTVNPYMGFDSVEPFLQNEERGAFVLALTSNPGAKDFQHLVSKGRPLYEHVTLKVKQWNRKRNCGLVVGATRPRQLQSIRNILPRVPFLIPGVGAQGGDLRSAVRYGCDATGWLALINASRSIIFASSGRYYASAAEKSAKAMRNQINRIRDSLF
jgi:orotidine-5'-phosphate decarboxylase